MYFFFFPVFFTLAKFILSVIIGLTKRIYLVSLNKLNKRLIKRCGAHDGPLEEASVPESEVLQVGKVSRSQVVFIGWHSTTPANRNPWLVRLNTLHFVSPRRTPCYCHQSCRNIDHLLVGLPLVAHLQTQASLGCNQVRSLCLNPRMSYSRAVNFLVSASGWVSYCDRLPKCIELVKMFIWVFP